MGPVTNDILQLTTQFSINGNDVTVLDAKTVAGWSEEENANAGRPRFPDDVELIEIDVEAAKTASPLARKFGYQPAITQILDAITDDFLNQFDVVHTHNAAITTGLAKRHDCTAYTSHTPGAWVERSQRSSFGALAYIGIQEMFGLHDFAAIKAARATIGLGRHLEQALKARRPRIAAQAQIAVIPNGTNVEQWPNTTLSEARVALAAPPNIQRLVTVGRFAPSKGIDVLLDALNEPALRNRRLVVDLIGAGPSDKYKNRCQSPGIDVEFHGFVSNRDPRFHNLVAAADLMVVPSRFDNQPNVVMEALAMNTPVVGSRVGAIPDMVDASVGCLFEAGNSSELADILSNLLDDPSNLAELSRACRGYLEGNFTWPATAAKHLELFAELIAT